MENQHLLYPFLFLFLALWPVPFLFLVLWCPKQVGMPQVKKQHWDCELVLLQAICNFFPSMGMFQLECHQVDLGIILGPAVGPG